MPTTCQHPPHGFRRNWCYRFGPMIVEPNNGVRRHRCLPCRLFCCPRCSPVRSTIIAHDFRRHIQELDQVFYVNTGMPHVRSAQRVSQYLSQAKLDFMWLRVGACHQPGITHWFASGAPPVPTSFVPHSKVVASGMVEELLEKGISTRWTSRRWHLRDLEPPEKLDGSRAVYVTMMKEVTARHLQPSIRRIYQADYEENYPYLRRWGEWAHADVFVDLPPMSPQYLIHLIQRAKRLQEGERTYAWYFENEPTTPGEFRIIEPDLFDTDTA